MQQFVARRCMWQKEEGRGGGLGGIINLFLFEGS
jgi:hypothetical protein